MFNVKTSKKMKTTKQEQRAAADAKKDAARLLLKDYIVKNPDEIAATIEKIIPFFYDCDLIGLQSAMNTVNATFAAVALDVIKDCANEEDCYDRLSLPVDAEDMKTAIYYLSRFVNLFGPLSALATKSNIPAIRMCQDAFGKIEVTGC